MSQVAGAVRRPISGTGLLDRLGRHPAERRAVLGQVAATVAIGWGVATFLLPAQIALRGVVVMVGAAVACIVFTRHPKWCLAAVLAATIAGLYRYSLPLGPLDLRVADGPLAALMVWAVCIRVQRGRAPRNEVGQLPLAVLLLVLGASLLASSSAVEGELLDLLVSLFRAVATFSLVWLIPYTVRTPADRLFVMRALVLVAAGELGFALLRAAQNGFPDRLRGVNGPNAEGLIAAVVLVVVINLPLFKPRYRVLIGVLAATSLVATKSIASISALMIVLGLFGLRAAASRNPRNEALVRPARVLVLLVGAFLLIATLRPHDIPSTATFENSSTAVRVSVGFAGLRIFREHPVLGVGWQRSSSPEVIGAPGIIDEGSVRSVLPGRGLGQNPDGVSVHNAYIQVLAEGGLVGLLVLLAALFLGRRGAREVVARAGTEAAMVRTIVAALAIVLVWWNDNPIFGAQVETVLFAVLLGLLASVTVASSTASGTDAGTRQPAAVGGG